MTDALGAQTGLCWAWWKAASKQHGHHRCLLSAGHPGPCGCCCGAVSEAVTHAVSPLAGPARDERLT